MRDRRIRKASGLLRLPEDLVDLVDLGEQRVRGGGGTKSSNDVATADALLSKIDEINKIFWETKQA